MNTRQKIAAWLASLAAMVLVGPAAVQAEDTSYSALLQRIETLESELAQQRMDFVSYNGGDGAQKDGNGCDKCGSDNGKGDCGCNGRSVYAGYELTILRPYISSNNANILGASGFDNNYGAGHRFTLGMEGSSGVGARMRYWFYNTGHDLVPPGPSSLNIDMDVFDIEATLSERLNNWDLMVSGGVRWGRAGFSLGTPEVYFEGAGPTVALEARREVGCRGLYLIGNFRASLLIGELHDPANLIAAPPIGDTVDDELATVLEANLGAGWSREMGRGELHLKALWETQYWLNDNFANDVAGPSGGFASNLGLMGVTVAAELRL